MKFPAKLISCNKSQTVLYSQKQIKNYKTTIYPNYILEGIGIKANRDNDGLVFIKEWLVTRSRIDNSQPLMSQVKVTALIEPTPIWTTVLQPVTIIIRQHYSSNCNLDTHKFVDYNSIIGPISPLSSSNLRNNLCGSWR